MSQTGIVTSLKYRVGTNLNLYDPAMGPQISVNISPGVKRGCQWRRCPGGSYLAGEVDSQVAGADCSTRGQRDSKCCRDFGCVELCLSGVCKIFVKDPRYLSLCHKEPAKGKKCP